MRRRGCCGHIVRLLCFALVAFTLWWLFEETDTGTAIVNRVERAWYPVSYRSYILNSAKRHDVDPMLVCAIIKTESNWDPDASSCAGAQGLMQLMPATAQELIREGYVDGNLYAVDDLSDPQTNIEFGCGFLDLAQQHFSSRNEVIASYNAGIAKTLEWDSSGGGSITEMAQEYPETASYIQRVDRALTHYQKLYTADLLAVS